MTTSFTFRDFLVYLMTGIALLLTVFLNYDSESIAYSFNFFRKYEIVKEFAFLITIFLIPLIYLIGHLVNFFDFLLLQYHVALYKKLKKFRYLKWFLKLNELLFYRHRIVYAIIKKSSRTTAFKSVEEFWILCAKLQKEKQYENAGYWYILNDLFKATTVVFIIGIVLAIYTLNAWLILLFTFMSMFSYFRAKQFATFFVDSIVRLSIT